MTQKNANSENLQEYCNEREERYSRIRAAVENVRNRPESRRGPFVISDQDLNDQFRLNK